MAETTPLASAARQLLTEAFHGASSGSTWFLDEDGLLATIRELDATQASQAPVPGSASIAAHVEHVRWFVAMLNAFARGERPAIAWKESWGVHEVDEAHWDALQSDLEREYEELHRHLQTGLETDDEQRLMSGLGTIVHVAYHVGAIRQMARLV